MGEKFTGSCLCGDIAFEIDAPFASFGHCYCGRCRKASGSGRASVLLAKPGQLRFTRGGDRIRRYDLPAAASFATAFCPNCGCPLPRLSRDANCAIIPAGSLDSDPGIKPAYHEHLDSRAPWTSLDESALACWPEDAK